MTQSRVSARSVLLREPGTLGLVFLLIALPVMLIGYLGWSTGAELARDGVWTTGQITDRRRHTRQSDRTVQFIVHYSFEAGDGATYGGSASLVFEDYTRLRIGRPVEIRYLPRRPSINEMRGKDRAGAGWLSLMIGLGMLGFGAGLLLWRGPVLAAKLRAAKAPAETARVTARTPWKPWYENRACVRLTWLDGAGEEGRSGSVRDAVAPVIGAEIRLRRDPRTRRAWWEGELG